MRLKVGCTHRKLMAEKKLIRRSKNAIQRDISSYNELHRDIDTRKAQYSTLVTNYYSLTTDIYELTWGGSFHCANRFKDMNPI